MTTNNKPTSKGKGRRPLVIDEPHPHHETKLEALLTALRDGNYIDSAAEYARVGERTVRRYIAEGRDLDARIAEHDGNTQAANLNATDLRRWQVWQAIKEARAHAEVEAVTLIRHAAQGGTWQAAAWYLERSAPTKWGRWERDTDDDTASRMTPEQARNLLEATDDTPLARYADDEAG